MNLFLVETETHMKIEYAFLRFLLKSILVAGCSFFPASGFSQAEPPANESMDASELATSTLLQDARKLLEAGRNVPAIPYLEAIVVRLSEQLDANSAMIRSTCLYQLGISYLEARKFEEAAETFRSFLKDYPAHESAEMARFLILDSYSRMSDPEPMKTYLSEMDSSGELARIFSLFRDPEYADMYRVAVISICSAYARSMDVPMLEKFLAYCDSSARCDIGLNLAMLEGGDRAFEAGEFITALNLYRLIQLSDELKADYEKRIASLTAELAKPAAWVPQTQRDAQTAQRTAEERRLQQMKDELEALTMQNYDNDVRLRMAQCYDSMERRWAAYEIFNYIHTTFPESAQAEQSRFFAFQTLMALSEYEQAKTEGYAYLEAYPDGGFFDEAALALMHLHILTDEMENADALGQEQLAREIPNRFADQICFLLGYIRFQQMDYAEAKPYFERTSAEWPAGAYVQEGVYWVGMCDLFLGQFDAAVAVFENYLNNAEFEPKEFAEDIMYRLGMARYGQNNYAGAEKAFLDFIAAFPESELRSEAYSMIGDLRGAEGDLNASLEFYAKARETALNMEQENYAVFQMAKVYELDKRFEELIALMEKYGEQWGEQGDFAQAGLWMSKAWKALGDDGKALDVNCHIITTYGGNPALDSIDVMLKQMIQNARKSDTQYVAGIKERLTVPMADAAGASKPLYYRLSAFFAQIVPADEREQLLAPVMDETDLKLLSPLPLHLRAETFIQRGEPQRVQEIYNYFVSAYSSSELMPDMLNSTIAALIAAGDFDGALKLADDSLRRFDGYASAGMTQKLLADALRNMKNYDAAIEAYNKFLGVRDWRGALTPQVLYWIGISKFEQGKTEEAFAYFQRVYVLYEGYPEWVAKAYEASVACLQKLERTDDVIKTWEEMVMNPSVAATPEGARAKAELDKLPGGRRD